MSRTTDDHTWLGFKCSSLEITRRLIYSIIIMRKSSIILYVDVGFPVGKNTPYKYIVVNIHYLEKATGDYSGNQIILSRKPYDDTSN